MESPASNNRGGDGTNIISVLADGNSSRRSIELSAKVDRINPMPTPSRADLAPEIGINYFPIFCFHCVTLRELPQISSLFTL
jgi:hypothetical protein